MDDFQRTPSSNSGPDSEPLNPNGLRAFETLGQFLEQDGWYPQKVEEKFIYRASFSGKNGDFAVMLIIIINLEQFLFYAVAASRVPEAIRHRLPNLSPAPIMECESAGLSWITPTVKCVTKPA